MGNCPGFITASNGLALLCTLGAGHSGSHVAGTTGGGVAAVWLEPAPRRSS
jgi:hypothetical protein